LKNHRAETRAGNLGLQRETPGIPGQSLAAKLRKCRHFRERPKSPARDPAGWPGIEDSNRDVSHSTRSL
jgi:hypothetical protein